MIKTLTGWIKKIFTKKPKGKIGSWREMLIVEQSEYKPKRITLLKSHHKGSGTASNFYSRIKKEKKGRVKLQKESRKRNRNN